MKPAYLAYVLTFALGLGAASAVLAQEEPPTPAPAKEEPAAAKEEPAKAAEAPPAKEEPAAAKETEKPAEAAAEAPKAEAAKEETKPAAAAAAATPAPKAPPAAKELGASAKSFAPLADSYKKAFDDMQAWMVTVDAQLGPGDEQVRTLQEKLKQNETAITQAKAAGDSKKVKSLQSENKQLTSDASKAQKNLTAARGDYLKQATQRAKQYQAASDAALEQVKAQSK
jgi:hypothetical protein